MLIDVHAHIGRCGKRRTDTLSAEQLIEKMDAWGIAQACVLPLHDNAEGWYLGEHHRGGHRRLHPLPRPPHPLLPH